MIYGRSIAVIFLIVFSFYNFLSIRIPGIFDLGTAGGEAMDLLVGLAPVAAFLCFAASIIRRAVSSRSVPWPILITLIASTGAAWCVRRWVDQLPGQEFKAVGAYFYLASPLIAALGIIAILAELRSARHYN